MSFNCFLFNFLDYWFCYNLLTAQNSFSVSNLASGNGEIAILILARGGSKGVRLKNLQSVGRLSLLTRAIHLAKIAGLEDVTVSTDHPAIALEAIISMYQQTSLINYTFMYMILNVYYIFTFKAAQQFFAEVKLQHLIGLHRFGEQRNFFRQEPKLRF